MNPTNQISQGDYQEQKTPFQGSILCSEHIVFWNQAGKDGRVI